MKNTEDKVDEFLTNYTSNFNNALGSDAPDIDKTMRFFSTCFIAANPSGVNCGKNDSQFKSAMARGYGFYKKIGTKSVSVISKEISILDNYHVMVKVNWRSVYAKKGKDDTVDFVVIYFLQMVNSEIKIFGYITEDEQKILKERGLIE